jgi:F-type H+-transporting ATPase subunit b
MTRPSRSLTSLPVCETHHKLPYGRSRRIRESRVQLLTIMLLLAGLIALQRGVAVAAQQPVHEQPGPEQGTAAVPPAEPAHEGAATQAEGEQAAHGEEAAHEGGIGQMLARLLNFAVLAGALVYLLRSPLATYLAQKAAAVRKDLVDAQALRTTANEQLEQIKQQLQALPGEIEALKARGAQEIAAEEARIAQVAAAERERLLEQTRREIELQLRIARRQLLADAAELSVGIASERIKRNITDQDQVRLVDRYLEQVRGRHE